MGVALCSLLVFVKYSCHRKCGARGFIRVVCGAKNIVPTLNNGSHKDRCAMRTRVAHHVTGARLLSWINK